MNNLILVEVFDVGGSISANAPFGSLLHRALSVWPQEPSGTRQRYRPRHSRSEGGNQGDVSRLRKEYQYGGERPRCSKLMRRRLAKGAKRFSGASHLQTISLEAKT